MLIDINYSATYSGRYFGGCNDAFSVFGFLAFLLALLDLVIELMNNNNSGRSLRKPRRVDSSSLCHLHPKVVDQTIYFKDR
jgi:hypothetical protein